MKHLIFIFIFTFLNAQAYISGNAQVRYGEDKQGFMYSEQIFDARIISGAYTSWFQFEFSNPPEIGRSINGLRKFRVEHTSEFSTVKFGDLYEFWGRGLVLNQIDNQQIDFDNAITGLYYSMNLPLNVHWDFIAGNSKNWHRDTKISIPAFSDRIPNYARIHRTYGSHISSSIVDVNVGVTYLQSKEKHAFPTGFGSFQSMDTLLVKHRLNSVYAEYFHSMFDIFVEYAEKRTDEYVVDSLQSYSRGRGQSFYGNINTYLGSWALTAEYKRYALDKRSADENSPAIDYAGGLAFQQPPTAIREHSSRLLKRLTHPVNFDNEVGFQFELNGSILDNHTVVLNYTRASMVNSWAQKQRWQYSPFPFIFFEEWEMGEESFLLPSDNLAAKPFMEIYSEFDGYFMDNRIHYKAGAAYTTDYPEFGAYSVSDSGKAENYIELAAHTYPLGLDFKIFDNWNIELKYERQILKKNRKITNTLVSWSFDSTLGHNAIDSIRINENEFSVFQNERDQDNWLLIIGLSRSPGWSLSLTVDAISSPEFGLYETVNYTNPLENFLSGIMDIENRWIALEWMWNISPTVRMQMTYGSLQGGIICTNGVCRIIEPFNDGFQISFSATL